MYLHKKWWNDSKLHLEITLEKHFLVITLNVFRLKTLGLAICDPNIRTFCHYQFLDSIWQQCHQTGSKLILNNLCSVDMKLDVSACSLYKMTWHVYGNYALLGCQVANTPSIISYNSSSSFGQGIYGSP